MLVAGEGEVSFMCLRAAEVDVEKMRTMRLVGRDEDGMRRKAAC